MKHGTVRAIGAPGANPDKPVDVARNEIALKPGEQFSAVTVTVVEGAASIKGRVVPAKSKDGLPAKLRVHIVPAEKESADDVLRFFEVVVGREGEFSVRHIPPGRYFVLPVEVLDDESAEHQSPVAWEAASRAKLRREAEAHNVVIELSKCQRLSDYSLRYQAAPASSPATK